MEVKLAQKHLWVLKNSFAHMLAEKLRARMPYKRPSRNPDTFAFIRERRKLTFQHSHLVLGMSLLIFHGTRSVSLRAVDFLLRHSEGFGLDPVPIANHIAFTRRVVTSLSNRWSSTYYRRPQSPRNARQPIALLPRPWTSLAGCC